MRLFSSRFAALAAVVAAALAAAIVSGGHATAASPPTGESSVKLPNSKCFGAAARDASRPCRDPKLRLTVLPAPEDAVLEPNAECTPVGQTKVLLPCAFAARADEAEQVVALVGDSHASHWRAAVQVAAETKDWRGISITRSGCPFSKAVADLGDKVQTNRCRQWNRATLRWFADHPEVHTVFVSQHSGGDVVVPSGRSTEATQIAGYQAVWKALPGSVTRIFVIRDTPRNTTTSNDCIERAQAARKPAGPACAVPLSRALRPDPAVAAARRTTNRRVKVIDLTSYMCSKRMCLPVIGGALVHKDIDHLTQTFSATLGPYLRRRAESLGVPGAPAGAIPGRAFAQK